MGEAVKVISGYSEEVIFAKGCWLPVVHPDDREEVMAFPFNRTPGDRKNIKFRMTTKEGNIRWIAETSVCTAGVNDGELILFGSATDV